MDKARIKDLLARLREELHRADVDEDLHKLVSDLDNDILAAVEDDTAADALLERAKALEAEFATKFPVAERCMREVIDTLARMGI